MDNWLYAPDVTKTVSSIRGDIHIFFSPTRTLSSNVFILLTQLLLKPVIRMFYFVALLAVESRWLRRQLSDSLNLSTTWQPAVSSSRYFWVELLRQLTSSTSHVISLTSAPWVTMTLVCSWLIEDEVIGRFTRTSALPWCQLKSQHKTQIMWWTKSTSEVKCEMERSKFTCYAFFTVRAGSSLIKFYWLYIAILCF